MGQLRANDFTVSHEDDNSDAPVVIINTCGFIDNAKQESINTILEWAEAKQKGLVEKVYVTGCLSERYKPDLQKEIPNIDEYFGTRDLPRLLKTLNADYKQELIGERLLTTPMHYAYFKVSEGCDRPCSFCAIPLMRGGHVSIPMERLIQQAKDLARQGVKELILIAQDLTYYGLDLYKKRCLAELLEKLVRVEGIEWLRLHYAFPQGFPLDAIDVIARESKICKYLDMPLQHITDNMLASMRRGTTKQRTIDLVNTIRRNIPGIAIRTTLIAGYPGETVEDFEEMKQWVQETKFERLGIFTYSHEENTHAFKLEDNVPQKEKQRRADEIMKVQKKISLAFNKSLIGKTMKVLIDRKEGDYFIGRTEFDSPEVDNEVYISALTGISSSPLLPGEGAEVRSLKDHSEMSAAVYLRTGDFVNVKITKAKDYDLEADVIPTKAGI